jgi:hypothetical protein
VSRLPAAPTTTKFAALHHRDYRRYFFLALIGMTAESVEHVVSYWVIFQSFHSPTLAGFAVIGHWAPYLFFSVYAGALADRFDCRKLIQVAQGFLMLASLGWAVLFLTGNLRAWHASVILAVHGVAAISHFWSGPPWGAGSCSSWVRAWRSSSTCSCTCRSSSSSSACRTRGT